MNKNVREAKRIKNFKKEGDVNNTIKIKKYPMALASGDPREELRWVTEVKLHLAEELSKTLGRERMRDEAVKRFY